MTSNKLVLFFLGIIFVIIIILSSQKISNSLRNKLGPYLPIKPIVTVTPTPTKKTVSPTPMSSFNNSASADNIPATGPEVVNYLAFAVMMASGIGLKLLKSKLRA